MKGTLGLDKVHASQQKEGDHLIAQRDKGSRREGKASEKKKEEFRCSPSFKVW